MRPDLVPLGFVLLVAMALLVLAILPRASARAFARVSPTAHAALCLVGMAAALLALPLGPTLLHAGPAYAPSLAIDGITALLLASVLLVAACDQPRPAVTALVTIALLAADPLTFVAATLGALLVAPRVPIRPTLRAAAAVVALSLALLALAWPNLTDPAFATIRAAVAAEPLGPVRTALLLPAALAAAVLLATSLPALPGAIVALGLLARLLLDLPGQVTPGWWGVPLMVAALAAALLSARRAAAATDLREATAAAAAAAIALAAAALGAALLARANDLLPAAALAVASAWLLTLAAIVSTALLLRAAAVVEAAVGTSRLAALGGLLTRAPLTGTALLAALASMSAAPLTLGFAAWWLLLQALLLQAAPGTGRLSGTAILGLLAAALAVAGLVQALLAAAAFRLAGTILLGAPRTSQAAAMTEPRRADRLVLAGLAIVSVGAGLCPFVPMAMMQPAVRLLAGVRAEAASVWVLAPATDAPGYAAPALLLLLAVSVAAASRLPAAIRPAAAILYNEPWHGGLAGNLASPTTVPPPLLLWAGWRAHLRAWPAALSGRTLLMALALALAAALGWAAR